MAEELRAAEGEYLMYKGQPLVREGDTICYGDRSNKCFLILEIISYKTENKQQIPDKILIQVVDSEDPGKIIKQGDKSGLGEAMKFGTAWLETANK